MSATVRGQIAAQITTDNPTWTVRAYGSAAPDSLPRDRVFVSVTRSSLVPHESRTALTHNVRIEVLVASTGTNAEDHADAALDQVLLSIERLDGVNWTNAERAVFDGKYFGYAVEANADSANVYRSTIINEMEA